MRLRRFPGLGSRTPKLIGQRREVGPDGWTCHVCGDYRPDALISVVSTRRMVGGVEVTQNVRYCIDREACVRGALDVRFV